jgi:hypothetical protein
MFTWTLTEAQDGLHTFDGCVSDAIVSDCETIVVTVNEVAGAPLFADTFESGTLSAGVSSITRNTTRDRAPGRNRTCDTRFRKPLLSPLSYEGRGRGRGRGLGRF